MYTSHMIEDPRTIGVEEEFLLVDPRTGCPTAAIQPVMSLLATEKYRLERVIRGELESEIEPEVKQEQIEVVSPPSATLDELAEIVSAGRTLADEAAKSVGARAVALGTSVVAGASHPTPDPRFKAMQSRFGHTFKEQLTCGFHVHVSVSSDDEGVAVLDRVRPWLPVILALSSNSPFWMGEDTGFSSFRYQAWMRWPTAGPYGIFGSATQYHRTVQSLVETGVLLDHGMIYFDARLSARYPTVEFRMSDVCIDAEHAVALAGLVRALVDVASQEWTAGCPPEPLPTSLLQLGMWSASRFGIEGDLINPLLGHPCASQVAVDALLAHVEAALVRNGDYERVLSTVAGIFSEGTGAARQRAAFDQENSLQRVVAQAINITHQNSLPAAASMFA